jgi:hypothetical protein
MSFTSSRDRHGVELGVAAEVHEVAVEELEDAETLCFLGSLSVRVNGRDIEPDAEDRTSFTLSCRMYGDSGVPPCKWMVAALEGGHALGELAEHRRNQATRELTSSTHQSRTAGSSSIPRPGSRSRSLATNGRTPRSGLVRSGLREYPRYSPRWRRPVTKACWILH